MKNKYKGAPLYIREISLENVRCFGKKRTVHFTNANQKTSQWNLIIGPNGSGKTTLLKSIILATISNRRFFKEIDLPYFQRGPKQIAEIGFKLGNSWIEKNSKIFDEAEPNHYLEEWNIKSSGPQYYLDHLNVFGYGAARLIGTTSLSKESSDFGAHNLFDDSEPLINAEEWLVQQEYLTLKEKGKSNKSTKDNYEKVKSILIKLLRKEISDIEIRTEKNVPKAFFKTKFGWVKLHELSLGYKSLIAWMVDLASRLMEAYPDSEHPLEEPAIVLVDEVDLHLHPKLQRELISFLTQTFKGTQFIASAHSPLIVQAMPQANIILLDIVKNNVRVTQNPVDIHKWRVDQILVSDLFKVNSPYSKETDKLLERRRKILSQSEISDEDQQELTTLNKEIDNIPIGETREEIIGFEKIKEFAKQLGSKIESNQADD